MLFRLTPTAHRGLFTVVILCGSFLLFLVQPLVARFALPRLGGAPGVWNSAMLTFQLLLLGGYAYAHAISGLSLRRQAIIQIGLLAVAALTLPIALADLPPPAPGWEVVWVPALFLATIGPVFFLLSAQASLMQRWYAAAPDSKSPYQLYAASNIGSFAGLVAYPFWFEPRMTLTEQSRIWTIGYLLLIALVALAAASRWNLARREEAPASSEGADSPVAVRPVEKRHILLWLALAAVPSGLMLSTTTLLTTDLVAMPLLWVIPLGLYLLSFSVAFSDGGKLTGLLSRFAPVTLLTIGSLGMISGGQANVAVALGMVVLLFVLAVALHGRLYALRPHPDRLTFFYLIVAAGGALGGTFTALIAPVIFDWVYEHAILLFAAALLLPQFQLVPSIRRFWQRSSRSQVVAALVLALSAMLAWLLATGVEARNGWQIAIVMVVLVLVGMALVGRRWAFACLFVLLMLGLGGLSTLGLSAAGARDRTYFGVYTIQPAMGGRIKQLTHGTTIHGWQWLDPERRWDPTVYYGPTSGVGIALEAAEPDAGVGVAGLGVGTLACYSTPGQDWTFFEIDPQVAHYSRDGTFSFISDCTPDARIVIGDARLELARDRAGRFDILVVDVFTSDAIPLHLLTEEAFDTYGHVLSEDGLLLLHISNRYLDLAPMVSALAAAGGWHGRIRRDTGHGPAEGLTASDWVALARSEGRLDALEESGPLTWEPLVPPAARAWTDDYASIVSLFRF